jgi:UDP-glucose 4-epimerase
MRIAITGATGNVGTALIDRLEVESEVTSIVGIARRAPMRPSPKTRPVVADVATADLRPHLRDVDVLVHLAWLFQPAHRPMVTWRANAIGSERVFAAAADAGVRAIVHASSVGAYSPAPGRLVGESWPTHGMPTAAYAREKAYAERVLDTFEARHPDIRVVRMRPAFTFQRAAATEQRRIFAGPFLPKRLVEPGRLAALPVPPGLQFQALHADDVAEAYRLAIVSDVRGAFNVAAEPVIDAETLASLLETRPVEVPRWAVKLALAAAWRAHLVPVDPALLDMLFGLPLLDTRRAAEELGWEPRHSAVAAISQLLEGMATGAGSSTPPLAPDTASQRLHELTTGVGERS